MKHILKIGGMTCKNCSRYVKEALQKVPGVEAVEVDLGGGRAVVDIGGGTEVDLKAMVAAVENAGYTATTEPG